MHEISLLENVLEILESHAKSQGFEKVESVCLEIGKLSCVEPDALRFGFDVVMKNTLAEHAQLEIRQVAGLGICPHCSHSMAMEMRCDPCHECGSPGVRVTQGDTLKIKHLTVI